jgi:hypothetical protein
VFVGTTADVFVLVGVYVFVEPGGGVFVIVGVFVFVLVAVFVPVFVAVPPLVFVGVAVGCGQLLHPTSTMSSIHKSTAIGLALVWNCISFACCSTVVIGTTVPQPSCANKLHGKSNCVQLVGAMKLYL